MGRMMCGTCRRVLLTIRQGSATRYAHAGSGPFDHDPVPVSRHEPSLVVVCDACSRPSACEWTVLCTPFQLQTLEQIYIDDGAWGLCEVCGQLVFNSDWEALVSRCIRLLPTNDTKWIRRILRALETHMTEIVHADVDLLQGESDATGASSPAD